jgi:hypothetical protein
MAARVQVIHETTLDPEGDWQLFLQWGLYVYEVGTSENGYRFIWKRPDGSLQPARGQARIPSLKVAKALMDKATAEGWGNLVA